MKEDPIVEETRKAGDALFARHGDDMRAVVEYLRRRSRETGRRLAALPKKVESSPKPAAKKAG